jgi:carbon storage regulator CsrA
MLVLSRKINETIVIGGNIRVTMTAIRSSQVRLAIEAPPDVPIFREELLRGAPPQGVEPERGRSRETSCQAARRGTRRPPGSRSYP